VRRNSISYISIEDSSEGGHDLIFMALRREVEEVLLKVNKQESKLLSLKLDLEFFTTSRSIEVAEVHNVLIEMKLHEKKFKFLLNLITSNTFLILSLPKKRVQSVLDSDVR
jgi:hypothetical protein